MFYLALMCILCVASLTLSLAFALWLVRCISCLASCLCLMSCALCFSPCLLSSFRSRLSAVDLLILILYMVSLDKQLYVRLIANQYRCFVSLVWRCLGFVLAWMHNRSYSRHLFVSISLQCLSRILLPRPIIIYRPNTGPSTIYPSTGPSTVCSSTSPGTIYLTTAWPSHITHSSDLI